MLIISVNMSLRGGVLPNDTCAVRDLLSKSCGEQSLSMKWRLLTCTATSAVRRKCRAKITPALVRLKPHGAKENALAMTASCMVKSLSPGGVAERPMAHVLKTCLGHTNVGSNPTPSARRIIRSDSFSNCPSATGRITKVATTKQWGGARVAEWARLLSECRVKPVAGSNPALPATNKNASSWTRFCIYFAL